MSHIPTPCHIINLDVLENNLKRISEFKELSGCTVLLAVKGFSAPYLFDMMKPFLDGISASGLFEARLGVEKFGKMVQTYSPAFKEEEMEEIARYSNTVVFNSVSQLERFRHYAEQCHCSLGLRINPQLRLVKKTDVDPCQPHSHLGVPIDRFSDDMLDMIDGIHIHAMCEQNADVLEELVDSIVSRFGEKLSKLKWINFGGGQMIGKESFDIKRAARCLKKIKDRYHIQTIIEPCEGIFVDSGTFATKVLDLIENDGNIAILDSSPVCHMQDALFRGWTRDILGEADEGYSYRLCGHSCYAGDSYGEYTFKEPLNIGDILYFLDTATYTWVKNNTFNGINFPAICSYREQEGIRVIKEYQYQDLFYTL